MLTRTEINEFHEKLVTLGTDWAQKKEAATLFHKTGKILFAKLGRDSGLSTISAKEAAALCDITWEEYERLTAKAEREEDEAKIVYDGYKAFLELLRTAEANERAANR